MISLLYSLLVERLLGTKLSRIFHYIRVKQVYTTFWEIQHSGHQFSKREMFLLCTVIDPWCMKCQYVLTSVDEVKLPLFKGTFGFTKPD